MFDYTVGAPPQPGQNIWSQAPLEPLISGVVTPFSYSMLSETLRRAWYDYYDCLGFEPAPGAQLVRHHQGRVFLNLTLSAELDAQYAGLTPMALRVDGIKWAVAAWEKPGLLAGFKTGRNRKKIAQRLDRFRTEIGAITQRAADWYSRIRELKWSQADILQVMEQIERTGAESLQTFLAARHNLERLYNLLLWETQEQTPFPANWNMLRQAVPDDGGQVVSRLTTHLQMLADIARADEAVMDWLRSGDYGTWQTALTNQNFIRTLNTLIIEFGHRATPDGEICLPRWHEDIAPVMTQVQALVDDGNRERIPKKTDSNLLDSIAVTRQEVAQDWLDEARSLLDLQQQATHAFAYILAGTRRWAQAASQEAMADGRIEQPDDVFFFDLEQVKEMMTGEWNISNRNEIRAHAVDQRSRFSAWRRTQVGTTLIGDAEGQSRSSKCI